MFNLSTSNSVGYNGISPLSDVRCTPQYDSSIKLSPTSPGGKLRAYLHSEAQAKTLVGDRSASPKSTYYSRVSTEDIYTFKDSDPHLNSTHSNSRLRNPPSVVDRKVDIRKSPNSSSQRPIKQVNGISPIRNNSSLHNGLHDKSPDSKTSVTKLVSSPNRVMVKQSKDLFSNYPLNDLGKFPPENRYKDEMSDTKNSIIRYNDNPLDTMLGSAYQQIKIEEPVIKKESVWSTEGSVTTPLFSTPAKVTPAISPRKLPSGKPMLSPRVRKGRGPAVHEALQRINPSGPPGAPVPWVSPSTPLFHCAPLDVKSGDEYNADTSAVQSWLEGVSMCDGGTGRAERLASRRAALRRRTTQLCRYTSCLRGHSYSLHQTIKSQLENKSENVRVSGSTLDKLLSVRGCTTLLSAADKKKIRSNCKLVGGGPCVFSGCTAAALACSAHCLRHIATTSEQRLFARCTAKFSDNTQCSMPVLNVTNHLPLCDEHTWKRDNYNKIIQESKPKKAPRKRPKPSAMIRPQKRNRKRKRLPPPTPSHHTLHQTQGSTSSGCEESAEETGMGLSEEFIGASNTQHIVDEEVVAQVLGLREEEAPAPSQETNIDLSTVFNDLFTAEQNEEYVPTHEETEELERALEAVNQDVKSLEKLTASQGSNLLLDALLDERALAETLASLPDVFSPSPNCTA